MPPSKAIQRVSLLGYTRVYQCSHRALFWGREKMKTFTKPHRKHRKITSACLPLILSLALILTYSCLNSLSWQFPSIEEHPKSKHSYGCLRFLHGGQKVGVALKHQVVNSSKHEAFQESEGVTEPMEAHDYKGGPCVDS